MGADEDHRYSEPPAERGLKRPRVSFYCHAHGECRSCEYAEAEGYDPPEETYLAVLTTETYYCDCDKSPHYKQRMSGTDGCSHFEWKR
jgi:hypothetical protein